MKEIYFLSEKIHELQNFKKKILESMTADEIEGLKFRIIDHLHAPGNTEFEIKAYEQMITEIKEQQEK